MTQNSTDTETETPLPTEVETLKLLLVEDDEDYVKLLRKYLQVADERVELHHAVNLADAIEYMTTDNPDVILLDLGLPDSNGFPTFTTLQQYAGNIPMVILTGSEDKTLGIKSVALGAQDYLIKQHISAPSLIRCLRYSVERKKSEESRVRLAAIEDFMSTLAHDLQIPILGAERIFEGLVSGIMGEVPPHLEPILMTLKDGNSKLLSLVKKLLDVYHYESQTLELELVELNIQELLETSLAELHAAIQEKSVRIEKVFAAEQKMVIGDRTALLKLFGSLLDNAIKSSESDGSISILTENRGKTVAITIRNFGDVIAPEDQSKLFQGFWHGIPGKSYVASTGMGLYLSNRIVRLHKGRIICESSTEEGTTFCITLPTVELKR